jgi:hypothetical protein
MGGASRPETDHEPGRRRELLNRILILGERHLAKTQPILDTAKPIDIRRIRRK